MPHKFRIALLILLATIVIIGLIDSNGIRAAVANNAWSVSFIQYGANNPNIDLQAFSPPTTHVHAGLLLAHQALKQARVDLAAAYLMPLERSSESLVLDTIAKTYFRQGEYAKAIEIWKKMGEWFTLEQSYRVLEGDNHILALESAYELFPERYARSLINAKLTKADKLLEEAKYALAISNYVEIIDQFPDNGRPYDGLAQAYWRNNQPEQAIQAIKAGWLLNEGDIQFMISAAKIYEESGLTDQALFAFQQALQMAPNNSEAQQGVQRLSGGDE